MIYTTPTRRGIFGATLFNVKTFSGRTENSEELRN
jgi:hypothetical protein